MVDLVIVEPKALTVQQTTMFGYCVAVGIILAIPFSRDLLQVGRDRLPALARRWFVADQ